MTDRQNQLIRNMRRQGLAYSAIAARIGLSLNTVKSFCNRNSIYTLSASCDEEGDLCESCGKALEHSPGKKKKRFCNDKCRSDWWNQNRRWVSYERAYPLICPGCGEEFFSYANKQRKYCGRDCYIHSRYGEGLP